MKQRREFLEGMRKKLVERRAEMTRHLTSGGDARVQDGDVKDSGDQALSLSLDKLQNSLEQTEINEVQQIDQALTRIDSGEYGLCVDCNEPIANPRLKISPYAARCIVCQEAVEQG